MIDLTLWSHLLTTDDNTFGKIQVHNTLALQLIPESSFLGPSVRIFRTNQYSQHSIQVKTFSLINILFDDLALSLLCYRDVDPPKLFSLTPYCTYVSFTPGLPCFHF